jgi:hypothetical protein
MITLTLSSNGKRIKVPKKSIEGYRRAYFQQSTEVNLYTLDVKETPEEIQKLMEE